jgi:hypothetical protein
VVELAARSAFSGAGIAGKLRVNAFPVEAGERPRLTSIDSEGPGGVVGDLDGPALRPCRLSESVKDS